MTIRTRIGSLALLLLVAGTACIRAGADHSVIEIGASDYAFELGGTETYDEGRVTITVRNDGAEDHMAAALRIKDGITAEELTDALAANDQQTFFSSVSFVGGVAGVAPGEQQVSEQILEAGGYLLICFIAAPDGAPHFAKGMLGSFTVRAAPDGGETTPVGSDGTIEVRDYGFDLGEVVGGAGTFEVVNRGTEPHEITVLAVEDDITIDEVIAKAEAPAGKRPFTYEAGLAPIMPGEKAWVQLDLAPGRYLAVCFVPSPKTGEAHLAMGMVDELIVT